MQVQGAPMAADGPCRAVGGAAGGGEAGGGDEVSGFARYLVTPLDRGDGAHQRCQPGKAMFARVTPVACQPSGILADRGGACFNPAVILVDIDMDRQTGGRGVVEVGHDLAMQGRLVAFEGKQIIAAPPDDGPGHDRIGGDGIDGDQRALEGEPVQDRQHGRTFVFLAVNRLLRQHQALGRGPGADQMQRLVARVTAAPQALPSSAIRSGASGRSVSAQSVKQASNSAGSIRLSTTRSQSSLGVPK